MYRDIQFEKIAKKHHFSYSYNDEFSLINLLRDFRLFSKLSSKKITNILGEKSELQESKFYIFDFEYGVWNGENEDKFTQTVFFVQSKKLALPHFFMEPQGFYTKGEKMVGTNDLYFEAFPKFTDQYRLQGKEEKQIRKVMSDNLLQYFSVEKDWSLEGLNYFLIFYKKDKIIPTTDLMDFYQKGKEIVKMFS